MGIRFNLKKKDISTERQCRLNREREIESEMYYSLSLPTQGQGRRKDFFFAALGRETLLHRTIEVKAGTAEEIWNRRADEVIYLWLNQSVNASQETQYMERKKQNQKNRLYI